MKNKVKSIIIWIFFDVKWVSIRILHIITGRYFVSQNHYGKHILFSPDEGNELIGTAIEEGKPFACCRFGYVELDLLIRCKKKEIFHIDYLHNKRVQQQTYYIPGKEKYSGIYEYEKIMKEACEKADILGVWTNHAMGDIYVDSIENIGKTSVISATSVEPYAYDNPWSSKLKGKKVLVVSPFYEEIRKQYEVNREHLFENKKVLPDFELQTMDSVWAFAGNENSRFKTWFDALDFLKEEINKRDFDIALLGCGPFGFPLAVHIKEIGRQAVQMGGAIQILFGIKGKRWDGLKISELYNEYWIRPSQKTIPENSELLDSGCYW